VPRIAWDTVDAQKISSYHVSRISAFAINLVSLHCIILEKKWLCINISLNLHDKIMRLIQLTFHNDRQGHLSFERTNNLPNTTRTNNLHNTTKLVSRVGGIQTQAIEFQSFTLCCASDWNNLVDPIGHHSCSISKYKQSYRIIIISLIRKPMLKEAECLTQCHRTRKSGQGSQAWENQSLYCPVTLLLHCAITYTPSVK
jgi:hypothetical protein